MPVDFLSKPPYNVVQPGAYSVVDASQLASPNFFAGRPIPAILGVALGGQPNKPLYFRSPGQSQSVLRGGAGYDAARFAFNGGAPQVCFVRVGNSVTQATLALAGTGGTVVTLTALDWGTWCNGILVTVASGVITLAYTDQFGNVFTEKWDLSTIGGLTAAQVAQAINGQLPGYNASNFVSAAAGTGTLPLATISATPLAGGTDGTTPLAADWTNGLAALETEIVDIVVAATSDATVHAQVQTHCQNMSLPNARRERVAFHGGALGETAANQVGTRMPGLRSARSKLVYPGVQDYNANGNLTLYDPFYAAALVAGMSCAQTDVAVSLVHKPVPAVGVEVALSTIQGGTIDQLLQAGVTPIAPAPRQGFWIVDDLTGYNQADGVFRDLNKVRSADFVAQWARLELETQFVGSKLLSSTQSAIETAASDTMQTLLGMEVIAAYQPAVVTAGPTVNSWSVQLPVMLVDTNKFIFITVALQPSSTTLNSGSLTPEDALS